MSDMGPWHDRTSAHRTAMHQPEDSKGPRHGRIGAHRNVMYRLEDLKAAVADGQAQADRTTIKTRQVEQAIASKQALEKLAKEAHRSIPKYQPTVWEVLRDKFPRRKKPDAKETAAVAPEAADMMKEQVDQLHANLQATQAELARLQADLWNAVQRASDAMQPSATAAGSLAAASASTA